MDFKLYNYKLNVNTLNDETYSLLHFYLEFQLSSTHLRDSPLLIMSSDLHVLDYEVLVQGKQAVCWTMEMSKLIVFTTPKY